MLLTVSHFNKQSGCSERQNKTMKNLCLADVSTRNLLRLFLKQRNLRVQTKHELKLLNFSFNITISHNNLQYGHTCEYTPPHSHNHGHTKHTHTPSLTQSQAHHTHTHTHTHNHIVTSFLRSNAAPLADYLRNSKNHKILPPSHHAFLSQWARNGFRFNHRALPFA